MTETHGEAIFFWVDLTSANGLNINLIDGNFTAPASAWFSALTGSGTVIDLHYPLARIGGDNHIYAYSYNGYNYYGLSSAFVLNYYTHDDFFSEPGLSVRQAYDMDRKIDDGFPQTGNVLAQYDNSIGGPGLYGQWLVLCL
jgi:hypothetical protein